MKAELYHDGVIEVEVRDVVGPQLPSVLVVDRSDSMNQNDRIGKLNRGIRLLIEDLDSDPEARDKVEIAVISFGGDVREEHAFVPAREFVPQEMYASGVTPMGEALMKALDLVEQRKAELKRQNVNYYRPVVLLLTDGMPTDSVDAAAARIHQMAKERGVVFFPVGVGGADMATLARIAPPGVPPKRLDEAKFDELFLWLSRSLKSKSASGDLDGQVALPPTGGQDGWEAI